MSDDYRTPLLDLQESVARWAREKGRLTSDEERVDAMFTRLRELKQHPWNSDAIGQLLLLLAYHADMANLNLMECGNAQFVALRKEDYERSNRWWEVAT